MDDRQIMMSLPDLKAVCHRCLTMRPVLEMDEVIRGNGLEWTCTDQSKCNQYYAELPPETGP
jgi:hypothetical protein